jgi:hypothetical protein
LIFLQLACPLGSVNQNLLAFIGTKLLLRRAQSGRVPCSGAERRDKVLDEVSTAIHGGEAAVNAKITGLSGAFSGWH